MTWLRSVEQELWATRAELDPPGGCVRKRMVEHIQRPIMFVEDELEVVVVCSVVDGDGHQIRRSAPKQSHRDAIRLARRQFPRRNVVYGFEHREIPSQSGGRWYSMKIASTGLAPTADQCASLRPVGRDLSVPATGQRRKVETIVEAQAAIRSRVVVADDDVLVREGLASVLGRSGCQVDGHAGDAGELLELVREHEPELLIVDIRIPPTHSTEGLFAAQTIRDEFPETGILVLSAHVEIEEATELLAAGDRIGYLLKGRALDMDEFVDSLKRIAAGGSVVDAGLVQTLVKARRSDDPLADLTTRECEVLALMAEGRSNAGIAGQLWLAEGTVEKHVRHILAKLRLPETRDDHRRVLAVVAFLKSSKETI